MNRNRETNKPQKKTERQMPKDMRGRKSVSEKEREKEQRKRSGRQVNRL